MRSLSPWLSKGNPRGPAEGPCDNAEELIFGLWAAHPQHQDRLPSWRFMVLQLG